MRPHSFWSWGNVLVLLLYASLLWETSLGRPRSISCLAGSVCPRLLPSNCWPVGYIARLHCLTFDPHKYSPPLTIWCKPQPRSKSFALLHQVWFLAYLPVLLPLLAIFTSHPLWWYVLAFQWHLQCWVCSRVQLRSLFEIMPPWAFWRAPISVRTLANVLFACLSWNLRRTVLCVACLCPSSESVETAPGTTWLKSTYLGQWHCWRHHTLIYHIYALKVIFHICYF